MMIYVQDKIVFKLVELGKSPKAYVKEALLEKLARDNIQVDEPKERSP